MIHHSICLDLEITDSEYHHDPAYTGETKPTQNSKPYTCRDYKILR